MFKKYWLPCLFIILLTSWAECSWSQSPRENGQVQKESSQDWAQIDLGKGYALINNVWNKGAASGLYQQRIFQETLQDRPAFGWQWQWPSGGNVLAYPEVVYGDKPWDPPHASGGPVAVSRRFKKYYR